MELDPSFALTVFQQLSLPLDLAARHFSAAQADYSVADWVPSSAAPVVSVLPLSAVLRPSYSLVAAHLV